MSTPYARGSAFERRIKKYLESLDYVVAKTAGSKSPYDLMVMRADTRNLLVQAKLNGRIDPHEREALWEQARKAGAVAVLAENVGGKLKFWICHIERGRGLEFHP